MEEIVRDKLKSHEQVQSTDEMPFRRDRYIGAV